jgi:hypothetical protein
LPKSVDVEIEVIAMADGDRGQTAYDTSG